ncbi:MAG: S9 family peptidase [Candidatus Marinimicrobia bacterium]|nr:S9 family peptidase [Candidatus Neomarinimicrobiota bacterium]
MKLNIYGNASHKKGSLYLMKLKTLFLVLTWISVLIAQDKIPFSLEELYATTAFDEHALANIEWMPDSKAFTYTGNSTDMEDLNIYRHDVQSGENSLLLIGGELKFNNIPIKMSSYHWTHDGKYLLIAGPSSSIWRHSSQAPYYLMDIKTKQITALADNSNRLRNVKLSPDGSMVGYVQNHNIYIMKLSSGVVTALTKDGTSNILNGEFDWVYEEEFGLADAWRWSPDSKRIAFWRFDQTMVQEFNLIDETSYYNKIHKLKYPKVGGQNAIVKIGVIDLKKQKTQWIDLGQDEDIYIPRIFWTNSSSTLAMVRLNRSQNHLDMLMANTKTGRSRIIISDDDPCYVDVQHDISFLNDKDEIVFSSESSGYRHAYIYDYQGNLIQQVTRGDWEITEIVGVDEKESWLYFYGKKESPLEQHIYRVKLDGTTVTRISPQAGWHSPLFSPDYQYFIDTYSDIRTPSKTVLSGSDGRVIRVLNEGSIEALEEKDFVYPEFKKVMTDDGVELNAYLMKPHNFDPSKKYPVLVYGYGGPGSQKVVNQWGDYRNKWHQYMSQQGYLIFCLDNRGTGGRGKAFENLAWGDLSKWSIHDQIEGAKYLQSLPFVDKDRLGFWGWSGGAYLTIGLMTRAADYFKVGVAVAPVTDFKTYDTIWTERHMGMIHENEAGYARANLNNYADLLKGKLLIIHGTQDDNVHYQNTLFFINRCIELNKPVDVFFYPNRNHSIQGGNTRLHLFTKMTDYMTTNL